MLRSFGLFDETNDDENRDINKMPLRHSQSER